MPFGPILIFDKSALQCLNPDEAVWLDNFFMSNITPLFFIETLADLEKQVRKGRSPEQVIGEIAYKTPDMQSRPNVHHSTLIASELMGIGKVEMRGLPVISGGQPVELEGHKGMIYREAPEEEALARWQRSEFLEVERTIAKAWRRALSKVDSDEIINHFKAPFAKTGKPRTLPDGKCLADAMIDGPDQEAALKLGLALVGVSQDAQAEVIARWQQAQRPPIRRFAPYFRYVYGVDLFFFLCMAADLISRERPSHRVGIAYLYYLPFCMVFTSNDRLHATTGPLFLDPKQSFVSGTELKADLRKLDKHYASLPDNVKENGLFAFAAYPPAETSFLVTRLWDKHLPAWRRQQNQQQEPLSEKLQAELVKLMKRFQEESTPLNRSTPLQQHEISQMTIRRKVFARKGKWKRFPPEVEQSARANEE